MIRDKKLLMWNIYTIESSEKNRKFGISATNDSAISNLNFLELLGNSQPFREFYNEILAGCGFEAFFWENKPVTENTLNDKYECNIIKSDGLAGRSPDVQTFSRYFDESKHVVTFPNLGKDARLIVPCPQQEQEYSDYTHIGNFVRNAGSKQKDDFWQITGNKTLESVGNRPIWLSTSGLGVFWLHARIDTVPKYYQTGEYKRL